MDRLDWYLIENQDKGSVLINIKQVSELFSKEDKFFSVTMTSGKTYEMSEDDYYWIGFHAGFFEEEDVFEQ